MVSSGTSGTTAYYKCSANTTSTWTGWVEIARVSADGVDDGTGSGCTSSVFLTDTWPMWSRMATTASAIPCTWTMWSQSHESSSGGIGLTPIHAPIFAKVRSPTPAEIAANNERSRLERIRRETNLAMDRYRAEKSEARARELLVRFLDDEQQKMLAEKRLFHVIGQDGKRYEVDTTKRIHNVFEVDELGRRVVEYCIVTSGDQRVPSSDQFLTQKLLLESDIERFKRVANRWDLAVRRAA